MADITEIIEESAVQLEIVETGGGQIEVVEGSPTIIEIVETSINSSDLDVSPQINTLVVESEPDNTNINISVDPATVVETTITSNVIEITENQVQLNYISQSFATQSIINNITQSNIVTNPQLTDDQLDSLLSLIFDNATISLVVSPSTFQRNNPTAVSFTFSVNLGDEILNSATFNSVDVTSSPNGSQSFLVTDSISKTYSTTYNSGASDSITKTSTAIDPQYFGISEHESMDNLSYANVNAFLNIIVQSSDSISQTVSPNNQFVYFLSTNSNATITDGNGFNNTADFIKTTITVGYANGSSQTLFQYRTRSTKTLTNFTYNIT
tara:strand:- start:2115 stop:3089 length:975 start_codon:yes stop_codon:yes gene_type:complete